MKEKRVRVGLIAVVVAACVGVSACSGTEGDGSESGSETSAASSSTTSEGQQVGGALTSLSVASLSLPEGVEFKEKVIADEEELEYRKWYTTYPGTDDASCVISLSVESDVGDQAAIGLMMEAEAMRAENLQDSGMDPDAPEGVVGTFLTYEGPFTMDNGTKKRFSSIARHWQTPGNTLIAIAVNANDDGPAQCDPEAIAATLQWNGEERPAGGTE